MNTAVAQAIDMDRWLILFSVSLDAAAQYCLTNHSWMHADEGDSLPRLDSLQEQPVDEELLDCLASEARDLTFDDQLADNSTLAETSILAPLASALAEASTPAPLAPFSGRGAYAHDDCT